MVSQVMTLASLDRLFREENEVGTKTLHALSLQGKEAGALAKGPASLSRLLYNFELEPRMLRQPRY